MFHDSSFDDIDGEICDSTYSLSASDYERSGGSGRIIVDVNYRNRVKLASEVMGIQEKVTPLGYMPTTQEMFDDRDVNEITPLLRKLGISGQGEDISSRNTRKVAVHDCDIRLEGNVPIILNSELFAMINEDTIGKKSCDGEVDESYDPDRPLHEQFTTIIEFRRPMNHINEKHKVSLLSSVSATKSRELLSSSSTKSDIIAPLSSSICDESSSSSSSTTLTSDDRGSEENSNDEMFQPLLETKQKLYTPRQLYELKKLHLKQNHSADYSHHPLFETQPTISLDSCKANN